MKIFNKYNIVGFLVVLIIIFMSTGFALYNQNLSFSGDLTLKKQGKLEIVSATILTSECNNLSSYTEPSVDELNLTFNVSGSSENYEAVYLVEVKNDTVYDYVFTGFPFNINSDTTDASISTVISDSSTGNEVNSGEILSPGESKIFKVKISVNSTNLENVIEISGNANYSFDNSGNIIASIDPKTGNIQGENTIACFTVSVINTYAYDRKFNLRSSNDGVVLVNNSGRSLGTFSVPANSTQEYEMCTMASVNSSFLSYETTTIITLSSPGINSVNVGELTLAVDKDIIASDKEIPEVGNVKISIPENDTVEGDAVISWDRIDSDGSSITNYYIILYNSDTGESNTYQTKSALTTYSLSNMSEGNYYAKVYGVDEAGNIGESYCDSATTDNGYCSMSSTTSLKWKYTITYSLSNLKHDDVTTTTTTAMVNHSFTTTLQLNTTSSYYSLPSSVTISMNDTTLSSDSDYTYNSSTGVIVINKITGDVTIRAYAAGGCLIEGTKVLLYDGTAKNIEDVGYDDLLLVWNYETGAYTYEYPIWIEKENKTSNYKKITFSDGTILKVFGEHGVFLKDLNRYVSVNDTENFKVGVYVAKIDDDYNISYVKVENIEIVYEDVKYYHVVSTRYYNIFANDILTTDGMVILSNLYGFEGNIKWKDRTNKLNDLYTYDDFKDIMPYYMFKGLRVEEGKVLSNYLSLSDLRRYLLVNQLNDNMLLQPIKNSSGERLWMVSTSDDDLSDKKKYLNVEGSYYKLKEPINKVNFKYWYNTADSKIYYPNDIIEITNSMHFIAVYN